MTNLLELNSRQNNNADRNIRPGRRINTKAICNVLLIFPITLNPGPISPADLVPRSPISQVHGSRQVQPPREILLLQDEIITGELPEIAKRPAAITTANIFNDPYDYYEVVRQELSVPTYEVLTKKHDVGLVFITGGTPNLQTVLKEQISLINLKPDTVESQQATAIVQHAGASANGLGLTSVQNLCGESLPVNVFVSDPVFIKNFTQDLIDLIENSSNPTRIVVFPQAVFNKGADLSNLGKVIKNYEEQGIVFIGPRAMQNNAPVPVEQDLASLATIKIGLKESNGNPITNGDAEIYAPWVYTPFSSDGKFYNNPNDGASFLRGTSIDAAIIAAILQAYMSHNGAPQNKADIDNLLQKIKESSQGPFWNAGKFVSPPNGRKEIKRYLPAVPNSPDSLQGAYRNISTVGWKLLSPEEKVAAKKEVRENFTL